jgi:hypothetical protein
MDRIGRALGLALFGAGLTGVSLLNGGLVGTASAQSTTDMSTVTCANFLTLSPTDQAQLALWMAGYFAGSAQRPVIDRSLTAVAPAALAELCAKSPQVPLIGAETRPLFAASTSP